MATAQEQQILQTRKQFEEQQRQLEQAKQQQAQAKRVAFTSRRERAARGQQQRSVREAEKQLTQQRGEFESQVLGYDPRLATTQAVESQYQAVTSRVRQNITNLNRRIGQEQQAINELKRDKAGAVGSEERKRIDKQIRKYGENINAFQKEKGGLQSGLRGSKIDVVKRYTSGELVGKAEFLREREVARQERSVSSKQAREQSKRTQEQLISQGKTLVLDKGKWTGAYYNPGDLPEDLKGTTITSKQIDQYKIKIETEQAKARETIGGLPVAESGQTKRVVVGYSGGKPIYREVPIGERVQTGFDTQGKPVYTTQYSGPVQEGIHQPTFLEYGTTAWSPPTFQTIQTGEYKGIPT